VIEQIKDGNKVVSQKRITTFINGVCDTDDPEVIEKLKGHPESFRTDKAWLKAVDWKDTEEGKLLMEQGRKLGIDKLMGNNYKYISKPYLEKLIAEKLANCSNLKIETEPKIEVKKEMSYQEIVAKAKKLGIPTHQRKKEEILNEIKKKEVITNA